MRRVEQLITQVRRATENTRVGETDGISDEEFVQCFNDCQELTQTAIVKVHRKAFVRDWEFTAPGVEYKEFPSDMLATHLVHSVEYSPSGNAADYRRLEPGHLIERQSVAGSPAFWMQLGSKLLVNPYPSSGSFRVVIDRKIRRLDKRRGTVASKTQGATYLTALTITPSGLFVQADYDLFDEISLVNARGVVQMSGIPFTAVSASGVVTIYGASGFAFASGELATVGDYVCLGTNASPTSELPEIAEKLLLMYCSRRILNRDSSDDAREFKADELEMLADITDLYAELSADADIPPVMDNGFFDDPDLW